MIAGRVVFHEIAQQRKEWLCFVLRLGEKQLLALVDRKNQRRRLGFDAAIAHHRRRLVGERLQERLELDGAGLDRRRVGRHALSEC